MTMEIAVTGGNGRMGRVTIEHLLKSGHRIRSIDRTVPEAGIPAHAANPAVQMIDVDSNNSMPLHRPSAAATP